MDELINGFTGFARKESLGALRYARTGPQGASGASRAGADAADGFDTGRSSASSTLSGSFSASSPMTGSFSAGSSTAGSSAYAGFAADSAQESAPRFDPEKLRRIQQTDRRWSWVEIDLNAIRHNVGAARQRIGHNRRLLAVVKADAYGHGAVRVAKTALNSGADYLGVATVQEAVDLREGLVNAPILILSQPPASAIPLLLGYKIMPSIYSAEFAIQYAEAADSFGLRAPYHLAVNTGMNRIGVRYDEVVSFMHQVNFHRALDLKGTFTHFATADCAETLDFSIQTKRFVEAICALRAAGIDPGIVHAANSAAIFRYPDVFFDMVRLGISLYGFHPCPQTRAMVELRPVMSVHARVTDTRIVPVSEGVSYGLNYRSPGSVKICTVPIGYADGLRRGLSGRTDFIVEGSRVHQVGNICMDQCMFEVDMRVYGTRRRLDPQVGDEVVVVGRQGDAAVTIDDMANELGTIQHEIAIGFGCSRLPRVYT